MKKLVDLTSKVLKKTAKNDVSTASIIFFNQPKTPKQLRK